MVARVNDIFRESKLKKMGWVWGGGRGRGRWTDRRTGPNQFAPSTSSKLGHNNEKMDKFWP